MKTAAIICEYNPFHGGHRYQIEEMRRLGYGRVVCVMSGNTVHVTVGSVEHPMTQEHYIEWVCLETEHGIQYAHLDPDDKPKAKFSICDGDEVRTVYAFCNQHDLWRK